MYLISRKIVSRVMIFVHLELLDDMTSVDLRFITRIVLRVMELLHYEQKWERLVDVALRFNAVTE